MMNKEEILAKSREENKASDERARYIELKGANFSIGVLILLWIFLSNFAPLDDAAKCAMGLMATATSFSNWAYQLVRTKSKTSIFYAILFFIAMVFYLILFLKDGLHFI